MLVDGLARAGWKIDKPRATMFVWAPIPDSFRSLGSLEFAKLLLTEAKVADPAVKAIEAWHEAYGTLLVQVHAEYDDDKDETHALLRDRLLSPYEDAAEEERRADQRARPTADVEHAAAVGKPCELEKGRRQMRAPASHRRLVGARVREHLGHGYFRATTGNAALRETSGIAGSCRRIGRENPPVARRRAPTRSP